MKKTYQPQIIDASNEILEDIKNAELLVEYEINDEELVIEMFCDFLTEKFIQGNFDKPYLSIDEILYMLNKISTQNALNNLVKKGILESYSDDNVNVYFLSDLVKEINPH